MNAVTDERLKLSHVWRAGRMLAGLTQKELSTKLQIPQSSISKYETMKLEPSASDWFRFCQLVGIDAHKTLNLGYIDSQNRFRSRLYSESLFRLPLRYRMDSSLKIRELIPFRNALLETGGTAQWKKFLDAHDLSDEMFYVYDFQVSLRLFLDIVRWSDAQGLGVLSRAIQLSSNFTQHGLTGKILSDRAEPLDLMRKLVDLQGLYQNALRAGLTLETDNATISLEVQPSVESAFPSVSLDQYLHYKAQSLQEILRVNTPSFQGFEINPASSTVLLQTRIA